MLSLNVWLTRKGWKRERIAKWQCSVLRQLCFIYEIYLCNNPNCAPSIWSLRYNCWMNRDSKRRSFEICLSLSMTKMDHWCLAPLQLLRRHLHLCLPTNHPSIVSSSVERWEAACGCNPVRNKTELSTTILFILTWQEICNFGWLTILRNRSKKSSMRTRYSSSC